MIRIRVFKNWVDYIWSCPYSLMDVIDIKHNIFKGAKIDGIELVLMNGEILKDE